MNELSIVVPTYNRADMVADAIRSMLELAWRPLTIVISDDGSTDNTTERVRELTAEARVRDVRLEYVRQPNKGAPAARNQGFAASRGAFVMFVDSDDRVQLGVDQLVGELAGSAHDFVYGDILAVAADGRTPLYRRRGIEHTTGRLPLMEYTWHTMGAVYRRELLEAAGPWNENLRGPDDWELQARIKIKARQWKYCGVITGCWRQHEGERIVTNKFRSSYTRSVVAACAAIAYNARAAGQLDRRLKRRLWLRIFRHAMELGSNGDQEGRRDAMEHLRRLGCPSGLNCALVRLFGLSSRMDRVVLAFLTAMRRPRTGGAST